MPNWIQYLTVATNLTVLAAVVRVTQFLTRFEFKLNLMWDQYRKEHGMSSEKD